MSILIGFDAVRIEPTLVAEQVDNEVQQVFWSSVVPSKIPVTSPSMAEELISINSSLVASPARARHQKEMW